MKKSLERTKSYFEKPEKYLRKNYGIKTRKYILENFVFKNLEVPLKVLDIGCGDGSISEFFKNHNNRITYVDFSKPMLDRVNEMNRNNFVNYETLNLSLEDFQTDEKYEVVLAIGLLAHVGDVDETINKLRTFVKQNGILIIQYSDFNHWISKINYKLYSFINGKALNIITRKNILNQLKKSGLNLKESYRYGFYPIGIGKLNENIVYKIQILLFKLKLNFLLQDYIEIYKNEPF